MMIRPIIHLILHIVVPGGVARLFYKESGRPPQWIQAWLLMCATMIVDLDHFFADALYDPNRCSLTSHPLHSYIAIGGYCLMVAIPKLRIISIGLLIHMALDGVDCIWMRVL